MSGVNMRGRCSGKISFGERKMEFLQKYGAFSGNSDPRSRFAVQFFYPDRSDPNLQELRKRYKLDEVAGDGSELQRIVNLMTWAYQRNGRVGIPAEARSPVRFKEAVRGEKRLIDCYWKNILFGEAGMAMGFHSRLTHLLPHSDEERESHFVTSVYSRSMGKWLMMDPESGIYVTDEQGNPLGICEIRRRLVANHPMKAVQVEKSWLKKTLMQLTEYLEGADYFWFLSDFIFKIRCPQYSPGIRSVRDRDVYFELLPEGYEENPLIRARLIRQGMKICYLYDEAVFWQSPLLENPTHKAVPVRDISECVSAL